MSSVLANDEMLIKIKLVEDKIEVALWNAVRDEDYQQELDAYKDAREMLVSLTDLPLDLEKERNRVLSYCLMRMDNTLVSIGETKGSVRRMREALEIAHKSESLLQITRCSLALGARLASAGLFEEAEDCWNQVLAEAEGHTEIDVQQVVGWTLITKGHFLNLRGQVKDALEIVKQAETLSETIGNWAGVAKANELMVEIYSRLNDEFNEQKCRKKSREYLERAKTEEK
ncbi:MAG: hypothetical protein ACFFB3_13585 [Candidatus Hodarchaeota archaeon]